MTDQGKELTQTKREILIELDHLSDIITELNENVSEFIVQISPILGPGVEETSESTSKGNLCVVAATTREQRQRLEEINKILKYAIGAVQV